MIKNLKKLALVAGLAGLTGCYTYGPEHAVVAPAPVMVAPTPVVVPAPVMVPTYRPLWHGPHFHHRHRCR